MRIKRRRGSVGIETVMVIPLALVFVLLGRFILEASLNRQDVGVFTRLSVVEAAVTDSGCNAPGAADARTEVRFTDASVTCKDRRAEGGLRRERPMWDALYDNADPWKEILRDVRPRQPEMDILGNGTRNVAVDASDFLRRQDASVSTQTYLHPGHDLWTQDTDRYRKGHDKVIWEELRKHPTHLLFPNVFPNG